VHREERESVTPTHQGWRQWWGLKRWVFDNAPAVIAEYKKLVHLAIHLRLGD